MPAKKVHSVREKQQEERQLYLAKRDIILTNRKAKRKADGEIINAAARARYAANSKPQRAA